MESPEVPGAGRYQRPTSHSGDTMLSNSGVQLNLASRPPHLGELLQLSSEDYPGTAITKPRNKPGKDKIDPLYINCLPEQNSTLLKGRQQNLYSHSLASIYPNKYY